MRLNKKIQPDLRNSFPVNDTTTVAITAQRGLNHGLILNITDVPVNHAEYFFNWAKSKPKHRPGTSLLDWARFMADNIEDQKPQFVYMHTRGAQY